MRFTMEVQAPLPRILYYMSETKLDDGSMLLEGGYPNNDAATSQTWVYRP